MTDEEKTAAAAEAGRSAIQRLAVLAAGAAGEVLGGKFGVTLVAWPKDQHDAAVLCGVVSTLAPQAAKDLLFHVGGGVERLEELEERLRAAEEKLGVLAAASSTDGDSSSTSTP